MRLVLMVCTALMLCSCGMDNQPTADVEQAKATSSMMAEAQRQIGMPNITNFQERKLMRDILELRDKEDLITFAYIVNLDGKLIYIGKCVGFGLPYSVQFTNPQRLTKGGKTGEKWGVPMPQPDPNGLFMPDGLSATWLMMLDPESNEARPVYVEPEIIVSPFPLTADSK